MNTERTFALDELGDPGAPKGSKPWSLYVSNEIRKALYDSQRSSTSLRDMVQLFKEYAGWQAFGFLTWEQFCEQRFQKKAEEIETTITQRMITQARAEQPKELARQGRQNKHDNHNVLGGQQGTSAEYLTARIARDRPDIANDMKSGKYKSVRAAAIDAGIVEPKQRYQLPTDATAAGRYLASKVDSEWMIACYDAYMKAQDK